MRAAQAISTPDHPDFRLDDYPLYNLNRTSATYTGAMASALKSVGMDQTQWRVLGILGDRSPASTSEIARRGVIKMPTLTRMLDRMERDGLIQRQSSSKDRRVVRISLTESGREALQHARMLSGQIYHLASRGISVEDMERTMHILKQMRRNMESADFDAATDQAVGQK